MVTFTVHHGLYPRIILIRVAEESDPRRLAQRILTEHAEKIAEVTAIAAAIAEQNRKAKEDKKRPAVRDDCDGVPDEIENCLFCGIQKHTCAWKYRSNLQGTKTTGGTCNCCAKACEQLKCTRSFAIWKSVGGVHLVKQLSLKKRKALQEDMCICMECKPPQKKGKKAKKAC